MSRLPLPLPRIPGSAGTGALPLRAVVRAGPIGLALLALTLGAARPMAAQCTARDTAQGYPVSVARVDGGPADTLFLAEFARAAALRWQTPSPGRRRFPRWRQVRQRALPPEPRWADDWQPEPRHAAVLAATLFRGRRAPAAAEHTRSGDRQFDQTLRSVFDDPMPQAPPLPNLPAGVPGDSLRIAIHFGTLPPGGVYRTVRFAARQRPVRVVPGSLRVNPPPGGGGAQRPRAVVKYDVGTSGRMVPGSFQLLEASDAAFGRAVEDALARASFTPAESDCRPVVHTVLQTFGT